MIRTAMAAFAAMLLFCANAAAQPVCVDAALVLAVDGSGSVTDEEYRFQTASIAAALRDEAVRAALRDSGVVGLSAVFWGDGEFPTQNTDWFLVYGGIGVEEFAHQIEISERRVFGNTDIGSGIWASLDMLSRVCTPRPIINISGDGKETMASKRRQRATLYQARLRAQQMGVTLNALAIADDEGDLARYYEREVVQGTGGFTMEITSLADYATAIRRKLVRELSPQAVAELAPHLRARRAH